ncbi:MAG: glycerol-3-phosphate responsive antiterminator [Clostridia bacterium]|nr:glycerol-3-phosphate responsive antiterminator [Clostridia bacterium]
MIRVNAAVRKEEDLGLALQSKVSNIFLLQSDILNLKDVVEKIHQAGKKAFVHTDFVAGAAKDKSGLTMLKNMGVDGIITTKNSIVKIAKEVGLIAIQRFFIIDSHSIDTAIDSIRISSPDFVEVMPGVIYDRIKEISTKVNVPVMAAGLIDNKEELERALESGAYQIATSKKELWEV